VKITFIALDGQGVLAGKVLPSVYVRCYVVLISLFIVRQFVTVDDVRILRDIGMSCIFFPLLPSLLTPPSEQFYGTQIVCFLF